MITAFGLFALPLMVTAAFDLQSPATRSANSATERIVGTWQSMTRTVSRADGTVIVDPVLGEKPTGRLVYDASGAVMLQMMRTGRKETISNLRDRSFLKISETTGSARSHCRAIRSRCG